MSLFLLGKKNTDRHSIVNINTDITFFHNEIIQFLLGSASFLVITNFLFLAYFIRPSEDILIFHYNVYFGVDLQGIWWQLYVLPMTGLFFFLIHSFFSYFFYQKQERIASYVLLFFSTLLLIGIMIAEAGIVFINY